MLTFHAKSFLKYMVKKRSVLYEPPVFAPDVEKKKKEKKEVHRQKTPKSKNEKL